MQCDAMRVRAEAMESLFGLVTLATLVTLVREFKGTSSDAATGNLRPPVLGAQPAELPES